MTDLPSETLSGFAAWHPDAGFDFKSLRDFERDAAHDLVDSGKPKGWRVVPVEITVTATGTGL